MKFIGRKAELQSLFNVAKLGKAALVVCRGRRRIGKSTLINEFATRFKFGTYIEIQGLAPAPGQTVQDQIDNFMRGVCRALELPAIVASDWSHAFELLSAFLKDRQVLLFFDEISWMGQGDPNFASKLKIAWDTHFSRNSKLLLVLCGSITSWIDENILNNTNFVGRVSLTITLRDLPLSETREFLAVKSLSSVEALKILSVTGGVPRYLEEIDRGVDAESNIKRLCFLKEGLLFNEFPRIFRDIFDKRADSYLSIVESLADGDLSVSDIALKIGVPQSGLLTKYVEDLIASGFLTRNYSWNLATATRSKLSKISISDNYLRFYLKYIRPRISQITQDLYSDPNTPLPRDNIASILGLQLEALLRNNLAEILKLLGISPNSVVQCGPYFQNKTKRRTGVQIDLLIQTKSTYYICEIKFKRRIGVEVVKEMQSKIAKLSCSPGLSIKPVLFYVGSCTKELLDSDYWTHIIEVPQAFWQAAEQTLN